MGRNGIADRRRRCRLRAITPAGSRSPWNRTEEVVMSGESTGKEVITFPDGACYEGEVSDGQPNGQASSRGRTGAGKRACFAPRSGSAGTAPANGGGDRYEGGWRDGKPNGQGVYTLPDGGRIEARFVDGSPYGPGSYPRPGGVRVEGTFRSGRYPVGTVEIIHPDGRRGSGHFGGFGASAGRAGTPGRQAGHRPRTGARFSRGNGTVPAGAGHAPGWPVERRRGRSGTANSCLGGRLRALRAILTLQQVATGTCADSLSVAA